MAIISLYLPVNVCILIYTAMYLQIKISILRSVLNININAKEKESTTLSALCAFVWVPLYKIRNTKLDSHPEAI